MRLSFEKILRVITLYEKHNSQFTTGRFERLRLIAEAEDIFGTMLTMRNIIKKWQLTGK